MKVPSVGHHREVAEEDAVRAGLLDLAGLVHDQPRRDAQRRGVGHVALAALDSPQREGRASARSCSSPSGIRCQGSSKRGSKMESSIFLW